MSMIEAGREAGRFEGRHYTEWAPEIDRLKRSGDLRAALALCMRCIDATERQAAVDGFGLPRGYTRNAAIILRKLGDIDGEIAVLERFIAAGGRGTEIPDRLVKARALLAKSSRG